MSEDLGVSPTGPGHSAKPEPVPVSAVPASVPNADYIVAFLREFAKHVDLDIGNALDVADACFDMTSGDPAEDARNEVSEWRIAG